MPADPRIELGVQMSATGRKGAAGNPVLEIDVEDLLRDLTIRVVRDDDEGANDGT